jgi:hypothetical protein
MRPWRANRGRILQPVPGARHDLTLDLMLPKKRP